MKEPFSDLSFTLLGIGGVSTAGKTTLSARLSEELQLPVDAIIHQDDYVYPKNMLPRIRDRIDWEKAETINKDALINSIERRKKLFGFVIVEGIFAFSFPDINAMYDKCIEIEISKKEFLSRKARDTRWGPEPEWYIEHIWNSYQCLDKAKGSSAETIKISGEAPFVMEKITRFLTYSY